MPISRKKKEGILSNLTKIIKDSKSVVFVNFHGLTVNDSTGVRKALKEKGIGYTVAKKTLTKKALGERSISGTLPDLAGELGLAYGADLIDPAREVYTFQKKLENKFSILGGIFEGKYMSKDEMVSVAQIPSVKTLHAQFVNLINSPLQRFAVVLSEIAKSKEVKA